MLKSLEIEQIIQVKRPTVSSTGYTCKVHAEFGCVKSADGKAIKTHIPSKLIKLGSRTWGNAH